MARLRSSLAREMSFFTGEASLLLGLLVVALLVAAAVVLNFGSRRATRVLEDVDLSDGPIGSFMGGLRWPLPAGLGTTNMPPTLVALELYPWGLRISARWSWLRPFMPAWHVRYEEIHFAEHPRRHQRLSKRACDGVRFRASVPGAPIIFWTSNWSVLLDLLEARGVAAVRTPTVTRIWTND